MRPQITRSRTWTVAAVGGAAALLTAACGSSSPASTANTASAPGITATTVTIGSTQPLTGPAAPGYSEIAPAANAYFKYVNAHGGVNGRTINYTFLDDQYNPTSTSTQTHKLILQDNVFAIFQALGTPTHLAVVNYINQSKVPDLFVASGCNCWNDVSQYPDTFGWQPNYTIEGKILGQYIAQNFSGKKIGYFLQGPNDEFGTDGFNGVQDSLQGKGLNVDSTPGYYTPTAAGAMAVGATIAGLQAAGVQVIVSFSVPLFTAIAEASAAGLNYHPQFVVSNVGSDPPTLAAILTGGSLGKKLPAGLIGGTISDTYLPILTDATNPWVSLFKSIEATYAPSLPWDGNVEYGMSEAYTFVQALKAAGQNPTRASIIAAVQNSHWTDGPGLTPYAYSSTDHNGFTGVEMVTVDQTGNVTSLGPVETTDDTATGAITTYTGAASTPPSNGIPSD
jgi:ABC-type branched-subunit amino acid transport system substrate-binding protein